MLRLSEKGLTMTELAVVGVLATIVMLGLVGFYLNSQQTWMDSSAQAITQRETTTLIEIISDQVHAANSAQVVRGGSRIQLELYDQNAALVHAFWWDSLSTDRLVHEGPAPDQDQGSPVTSICRQFLCTRSDSLVDLDLTLQSAEGVHVRMATRVTFFNRGGAL